MEEQFNFVRERALIAHMNTRTEMHGEDSVPAIDVKIEMSLHNSVLNKLHPKLRELFYTADKQMDIEQDHLVNLQFPLMSAFGWDLELPRAVLTLHEEDGDFVIQGKANKLKLELLEGGTTKLQLRFQMGEIAPSDAAHLFSQLRQTVSISLSSAAEEAQPDNFEQADILSQGDHSEARKNAEKAFAGAIESPDDIVTGLPELETEEPPQ